MGLFCIPVSLMRKRAARTNVEAADCGKPSGARRYSAALRKKAVPELSAAGGSDALADAADKQSAAKVEAIDATRWFRGWESFIRFMASVRTAGRQIPVCSWQPLI